MPSNLTRTILLIVIAACAGGCAGNSAQSRLERQSAESLYTDSQRAMRGGDYARAAELLELIDTRHPFSEVAPQARLDLIYAYYKNEAAESALETADQFIRENPRHPQVDYAYYMRGLALFVARDNLLARTLRIDTSDRPATNAERSFANFMTLLERFPDSKYASDARQRMVYLRNRIAAYEFSVAEYYIRRGAWLAAINRGNHILQNQPGATVTPDVLALMIRAYRELGIDDTAGEFESLLAENYPRRAAARRRK